MIILVLLHKKSVFQGMSEHPWHFQSVFSFARADNKVHDMQVCTTCTI